MGLVFPTKERRDEDLHKLLTGSSSTFYSSYTPLSNYRMRSGMCGKMRCETNRRCVCASSTAEPR